jgi:vanillate O-demethylase monooxygenase subunit
VPKLDNLHPALRRCWHPVALSSEVGEEPVGVELLGVPYVVFRAGDRLAAFVDRCPHRLAPLSLGSREGDGLRCGYHGWRFGGDGRCTEIPALGADAAVPPAARLCAAAEVAERLGIVFVAPEPPLCPLPAVEEDGEAGFVRFALEPTRTRASAGLLIDNFLDFAHFPFVHTGTFGADESAELMPYGVEREGLGFRLVYEHPFTNREDPGVAAGIRPLVQTRRMTYRYLAPFFGYLRLDYVDAGGTNVIAFLVQPESEETCRIYTVLWRNDLGEGVPDVATAAAFEQRVLDEDLRIQSRYRELALPLDLRTEVHTRADRNTMELRRVLAALVEQAAGEG